MPDRHERGREPVRGERPAGHRARSAIYRRNNLPVQYLGRGSDGRTPTFSQTDLLVQHAFRFAGTRSLQISLNVLNLFNQDTAVGRFSTYQKINGAESRTTQLFYRGQQTLAQI